MKALHWESAGSLDHSDIADFLSLHWPRRIALSDRAFYDWQMRLSPFAAGHDQSLVLLDGGSRIVGFHGITPRPLVTSTGASTPAAETTTLVIAEATRGGRAVWDMLDLLKSRHGATFGANTSQLAMPILRRVGYRNFRCIERMVRVYDAKPFVAVAPITPQGRALLNLQRDHSAQAPEAAVVDSAMLSRHFADFRLPGVFHLQRDAAFLDWRYLQHPYYRYELYLLAPNDADRRTLLIFRQEDHDGYSIGHIMDILPLGRQIAPVPAFIDALAYRRRLALVDFYCSIPRLAADFRQAKWLSTINDEEYSPPGLFNPLEMRKPATFSVTFRCPAHDAEITDMSFIHLSKGDMDLDRPTGVFIDRLRAAAPTQADASA